MNNEHAEHSIEYLSNEFAHQKYLLRHDETKKLFHYMEMPNYLVMSMLKGNDEEPRPEKIYLKEISQHMELPMYRVSGMVKKLEEKGMVAWTHDANGTYITLTDHGKKQTDEQASLLKKFYGTAIETFGREKFIQMLDLMKQFGDVSHELLGQTSQP